MMTPEEAELARMDLMRQFGYMRPERVCVWCGLARAGIEEGTWLISMATPRDCEHEAVPDA